MKMKKAIDLGEYIVEIEYDKTTGYISVGVYDEAEELIESITITNAEDKESGIDTNPSQN